MSVTWEYQLNELVVGARGESNGCTFISMGVRGISLTK